MRSKRQAGGAGTGFPNRQLAIGRTWVARYSLLSIKANLLCPDSWRGSHLVLYSYNRSAYGVFEAIIEIVDKGSIACDSRNGGRRSSVAHSGLAAGA